MFKHFSNITPVSGTPAPTIYGFRSLYFGSVFMIILTVLGCENSSTLSRSKAERMLKEHQDFKEPVEAIMWDEFFMGKEHLSELDTSCQRKDSKICQLWPAKNAGLIRYAIRESGGSVGVKPELTDEGRKYLVKLGSSGDSLVVKGCERKLLKVTGIVLSEVGEKTATVEYEWTTDNATPFGNLTYFGMCSDMLGKIQNGTAMFRLYDDGWRISDGRR